MPRPGRLDPGCILNAAHGLTGAFCWPGGPATDRRAARRESQGSELRADRAYTAARVEITEQPIAPPVPANAEKWLLDIP